MKKGIDHIGIFVCAVCHDGDGNVLFCRRGKNARDEIGKYNIGAGGSLEFGETMDACLEREMEEEIGTGPIESEFIGMRELFRELNNEQTHWIGFYYKVLVDRESVRLMPGEEHDEMLWAPFAEHPSPMMTNFDQTFEKFKTYF